MTDRELMQQALAALEWASDMIPPQKEPACDCPVCVADAALRERLAQPEQDGECPHCDGTGCVACDARKQPKQEPVAWMDENTKTGFTPRYIITPRKGWQGLTETEQVQVAIDCGCADVAWLAFARAIEAQLKEKNT